MTAKIKNLKNKKGFTLTELIVVIVVIGILAAVLIPTLTGYITKAKKSAAEQEAAGYKTAYATWLVEGDELSLEEYCEQELEIVFKNSAAIDATTDDEGNFTGFVYTTEDGKYEVKFVAETGKLTAKEKINS